MHNYNYVAIHNVIVVTQTQVICLICIHDAQGRVQTYQETRVCLCCNKNVNFNSIKIYLYLLLIVLPIYITMHSHCDYGIFILKLQ